MLETLSDRLQSTVKKLRGQARLTEANIQDTLRDVRRALLEADVALPVVKQLIDTLQQKAVGQEVVGSLTPGQQLIKVVQRTLIDVLGTETSTLNLRTQPPAVILVAGLQGVGKTTSIAKLAKLLKGQKKKVLLVSADTYRPAARDQLATLAQQIDVRYEPCEGAVKPIDIATQGLSVARRGLYDILLVDTAGRLHVDADMMDEIVAIHQAITPIETLLVSDAQAGQDAVNSAASFHQALPISGLVMTKVDGDARGGAILSVREVVGQPIKYLTTGEKLDAIEIFNPERVVSRILGMGDMIGMIEDIERKGDAKQAKKTLEKMRKGKGMDLNDFRAQLQQMLDMGGMNSILSKMPGMGAMQQKVAAQMNDKSVRHQMAVIDSMTPHERSNPNVLQRTHKLRIASGSGTSVQQVNQLLKQFMQMSGMMKKMKNKKQAQRMLSGLKGMMGGPGGLPPTM